MCCVAPIPHLDEDGLSGSLGLKVVGSEHGSVSSDGGGGGEGEGEELHCYYVDFLSGRGRDEEVYF